MDDLRFFELFGDIDADIVQQANDDLNAWQEAQKGVVVRAGSPQRTPLKIVLASVACAAAVFGAVFMLRNYLKNGFMYEPVNSSNSSVQGGENGNAESEIAINSDVMWGLGKTMDELTERYGEIVGSTGQTAWFKNGYGIYLWGGEGDICTRISKIKASDILIGDLSTVNFDNIVSKCGFDVILFEPESDGPGLYDDYHVAYFSHPSYKNITFLMTYKISGFDEDATFLVYYDENSGNINHGESGYTFNGEVLWAIGKTFDEVTERYGEVAWNVGNDYRFNNGYGIYTWPEEGGGCIVVGGVSASDFLTGDLSTVDLDNMASKYGLENYSYDLGPFSSKDPDYATGSFTHPSYKNLFFIMNFKKTGFDENASFIIRYDDDNSDDISIPSGEPTFLVGPDGKPIYTGEITRLENTDKTAETLTEEDYNAMIYCDGFAYFIEPCGIGYDNYKNPELFDGTVFIGEVPENKNEWKRAYVGDEIFGLKVKSAYSEFFIHDPSYPPYTGPVFSNSVFEFEGTLEVEGFLCIDKKYNDPDINELMFLFAPTADIPLAPIYPYASDEEMYAARFEEHFVDPGNKYLCVGEYYPIQLGRFADVSCDLDGIGLGDIAYVRVTLNNISIIENIICATPDKVELLSDILAHDE